MTNIYIYNRVISDWSPSDDEFVTKPSTKKKTKYVILYLIHYHPFLHVYIIDKKNQLRYRMFEPCCTSYTA